MANATRTLLDVIRLSTGFLAERGSGSARLDAELVCAHALGLRRIDVYLQFDRPLDDTELTAIRELVRRRGRGEPVAHIIGEREFFGRGFTLTRDVLVPRPETETLVDAARRHVLADGAASGRVADLGTGSGCVAITLAIEAPSLDVVATDISTPALDVARRNVRRHGVDSRVALVECSWADGLDGDFDLIVSNPPYVTTAELAATDPDVREFEPHSALLGGDDGLDAYRALLASVRAHVVARRIMLEVDPRRASALAGLIAGAFPEASCTTIPDLAGRERVVDATLR